MMNTSFKRLIASGLAIAVVGFAGSGVQDWRSFGIGILAAFLISFALVLFMWDGAENMPSDGEPAQPMPHTPERKLDVQTVTAKVNRTGHLG